MLYLAACAPVTSSQPAADAPGTPLELTVWQVPNHPEMESIVEELLTDYESENNVNVDVVIIPWGDLDTMWASAIESGETPAFGYMYDFRLPTHYRSGALEPLEQYFTPEELDRLLPEPLQTATYEGHVYAIPMLVTSDHLVYNKDIFAAAGIEPPADPYYSPTWEEFLDWAQKIKAAGYGSFDYGLRNLWNHPIDDFYMRFGCRETNAEHTEMTFDSPECLAAAQAWADLSPTLSDKTRSVAWSPFEEFFAGTTGMAEGGAFLTKQLAEDYPEINWGVMLPFHDQEEKAYLGIGYYAMFADAENKEAVVDLLKYMTSDEHQVAFNSALGTFPPIQDIRDQMYPDATGDFKTSLDLTWHLLESGKAKFLVPWPGFSRFADEVFMPNWQSMMLGDMTPEEFVALINEEGNVVIQEEAE
jgi:multiple sugar transport system substrate-binding protein